MVIAPNRGWPVLGLVLGLGALAPRPATAQGSLGDRSSTAAKRSTPSELAGVADEAYRLGQYGFAIQGLKQANQTKPKPQLWLAIADAYHQRFLVNGAAYDRLQAITYYDGYLDARPRGPEGERARQALADLEGRKQGADDETLARARAAERTQTRLAVTASTMNATVRIDGAKAQKLPLFVFIKPGKHSVVVSAAGYQSHVRELSVESGFAYGVKAQLDPEPAKVSVNTTTGAQVHLDGRLVGVAPFDEPVEVEPGRQRLSVTKSGHLPHSEQVTLTRGALHELEVDLSMTRQRIGAVFLVATGGAAIFTGIVTGVLSFTNETDGNSSEGTEEGVAAMARSRDFRVLSGMTMGVGLGLSLSGGLLLVFDEPAWSLSAGGPGEAGATVTLAF
jgi:hypothetical protein